MVVVGECCSCSWRCSSASLGLFCCFSLGLARGRKSRGREKLLLLDFVGGASAGWIIGGSGSVAVLGLGIGVGIDFGVEFGIVSGGPVVAGCSIGTASSAVPIRAAAFPRSPPRITGFRRLRVASVAGRSALPNCLEQSKQICRICSFSWAHCSAFISVAVGGFGETAAGGRTWL